MVNFVTDLLARAGPLLQIQSCYLILVLCVYSFYEKDSKKKYKVENKETKIKRTEKITIGFDFFLL